MRRPRSVRAAEVGGKRVLVRADLNVPLEDGRVADDTRIRASLPTLELLLERDAAAVVVCSHLGRPQGPDPAFAMAPVAARLRELLPDGRVEVLENTRFDPGETKNDPETARRLADANDLFVNDAFGSSHRAHASTVGVAKLLPAYAGLLLLASVWCSPMTRSLWQALLTAGLAGWTTAIGVHPAIGYNDPWHLAPAVTGASLFTLGMICCRDGLSAPPQTRAPAPDPLARG